MNRNKDLTSEQREALIETLKVRFEKNMNRHESVQWPHVLARLESAPGKLVSLMEMEDSGGEPDAIGYDEGTGSYIYCDCSAESPAGRRNLCYDDEALESRKKNKPQGSAVQMAARMGINILTEDEYRGLQELGEFDTRTSSWIDTPGSIRKPGGALFGDRRYDHVFLYHNGAESYYSARGFRGSLQI